MTEDKIIVFAGESDTTEEEAFIPHNPLHRPKIRYTKPIITFLVYIIQLVGLICIPYKNGWTMALVLVAYSLIYFSCIAKRTIIWLVHLYQSKAPDKVRLRCVMEPSCSVYMILAVEKYGVIRGVYKGVRRLFRCGRERGVDYP